MKTPVRVVVTGAAGQISYALLFRIASGQMLGKDQPVILQLLEIQPALRALSGVVMELEDCAFPLLDDIIIGDDPGMVFGDADFALLVGAKPRGLGMERSDLLTENAHIFSTQGRALNKNARPGVRVLVVGTPANTNALIASANAPDIDPKQFTAMTRLDHNRAVSELSKKLHVPTTTVQKMVIWGNHSATQYPDVSFAEVGGQRAQDLVGKAWLETTFIPTVQRRGMEIQEVRGASSAASAASAAIDHMNTWIHGTDKGNWTSMAIPSDGSYGVEEGLISSFPVTCQSGHYSIVSDLSVDEFSKKKILNSVAELRDERDAIRSLL